MSNAQHTPGPWFYVANDEWSHRVVTKHADMPDGTPGYWNVCDINKLRGPEHEANGRLIASAPELLAALVDCRRALEIANFTQELAFVDAAIAKATGERA